MRLVCCSRKETTALRRCVWSKVTAKIDFSMMVLLDIIKKGLQGSDFRCRQVLPTSGHRSCSVWDVPDIKVRISPWNPTTWQHPRGHAVSKVCFPLFGVCADIYEPAAAVQSFQEWLDETMEANCESEVFEVCITSRMPRCMHWRHMMVLDREHSS